MSLDMNLSPDLSLTNLIDNSKTVVYISGLNF